MKNELRIRWNWMEIKLTYPFTGIDVRLPLFSGPTNWSFFNNTRFLTALNYTFSLVMYYISPSRILAKAHAGGNKF